MTKKHMRGRPLLFKTEKELRERMEEYFNKTDIKDWTITGLALHLDTSRETLINYQKKEEYFDTIKKGKDMVEHSYELDLKHKGNTGSIFALKNFDWKDKQETDLTTGGEKLSLRFDEAFNETTRETKRNNKD